LTTKFENTAIWAVQETDKATGSTIVPKYQTSTYSQAQVGVNKGYEYSRCSNPNRTALDTCLAALEKAK
jgi:cystathionine beta-lyase/cystathionine gamma-synthase